MILNWLLSSKVRDALAMRKHVHKLLAHQKDILSPQAIEAINSALSDTDATLRSTRDPAALKSQMEKLESTAKSWLKPYPFATMREQFEVLLVALAVAMGIRTFFLQPFKIPTGSMQPTLYGVTSENLIDNPEHQKPTGWNRVREWFAGVSYVELKAEREGPLQAVGVPLRLLIFGIKQTLYQGGKMYTLWAPPDYGAPPQGNLETRAGLVPGKEYQAGEWIVRLKVQAGDHLFVDRLTYNFRSPNRGEIVVFETKGIMGLPQDQFYIKRLVALGGEKVVIGQDRHLVINGKRLDASVPHFEGVYSFDPKQPPEDSAFSGHVGYPQLAPYFQARPDGVTVAPDHYMVMGDNTMNSLDSRAWGDFPANNVIGKAFFVYWPITERFGWGYNR